MRSLHVVEERGEEPPPDQVGLGGVARCLARRRSRGDALPRGFKARGPSFRAVRVRLPVEHPPRRLPPSLWERWSVWAHRDPHETMAIVESEQQ
ncbi:hypothetical protein AB0H12_35360 [Actinosynnema sp. NPDC023794]